MKTKFLLDDWEGWHSTNESWKKKQDIDYKDKSLVVICPSRGQVSMRAVKCWFNLLWPMNGKLTRLFIIGAEVGAAYEEAFASIFEDPQLTKHNWKYALTLEEDNTPPADGVLKLIESMETSNYSAIGGLYFTKGIPGRPMIYGNPTEHPINFVPQDPIPDTLQPCNGLGMGFTLFDLDMFRSGRIGRPWFKTVQELRGGGTYHSTQDLYFFNKAGAAGYKFAVDTRVKVGHYDSEHDVIW